MPRQGDGRGFRQLVHVGLGEVRVFAVLAFGATFGLEEGEAIIDLRRSVTFAFLALVTLPLGLALVTLALGLAIGGSNELVSVVRLDAYVSELALGPPVAALHVVAVPADVFEQRGAVL